MIDPGVRNDFYGLDQKVFFNNAAHAPLLKCVKESIDEHFSGLMSLNIGDHEAKEHLDTIRVNAARLINADPSEIEFAMNTSWGINLAALGLNWQAGDEILIPDNEFPSLPYPFQALQQRGAVIKYIPTPDGFPPFAEITRLASPRTKLLAISFVQYYNGFRNDLKALGEFCRERGIFFLVDAIQGLGACPLDVKDCRIDLLATGAQKWLLSPLGAGFFYVSKHAKRPLRSQTTGWMGVDWKLKYTDLRHFDREPFEDARRFNLGTYPYLQVWGMSAALKYILSLGVANIFAHNLALVDRLLEFVRNDDYYRINSPLTPQHRSQIVSISSPQGQQLQKYLLEEGFLLVYREGGVRVAVNFYNTIDEIDRLIAALQRFKSRSGAVGTKAGAER
ncbi:MAG: aminotransferase class V-fold PLP-dependent enzyme [candidate division Zixibacteria bacterium]|nr:aminotransferase class V-fold PLP-dependent enzyme [candidate division Zixibacteria bacterium]